MTRPGSEQYDEDDDDFEDQTAVIYLEKPVSPDRLASSVRQALGFEFCAKDARPISLLSQTVSRALTILLAEDTPANQQVVSCVLSRRGHRVVVVDNGVEAVAAVEREAFDVVLMDMTMPVMDGYEATEAIRQRQKTGEPRLPVIALTAHAMQGDREKCTAAGVDAYLAKPIDVGRLIELVEGMALGEKPAEGCASQPMRVDMDLPTCQDAASSSPQPVEIENGRSSVDEIGEPVVDYRAALRRLGGDETLFRDVVRLFDQDAPELLQRIRTSIHEDKAEELQRAAHSLKGLAANFGAKDAIDSAYRLEQVGESRCLDGVENAADDLEHELARLTRALSPYRAVRIAEREAPMA
jgi:CheY-like chemotaxis protein